ncbi:hypothetical protein PIB30_016204 [Stylosanthes scabra]|uniref:Uncharacterized protein n=1 Tax=Stylosanthes scabra TaxID=79078 RepID=A0ABU6V686_9FABA|nr:hypothetical protein [Stylosanthes scabra]
MVGPDRTVRPRALLSRPHDKAVESRVNDDRAPARSPLRARTVASSCGPESGPFFKPNSMTRPLGAGTFVRCSLESPLSLADGVWNVLKEVSQGATKIPSMRLRSFCSGSERKSLFLIGLVAVESS